MYTITLLNSFQQLKKIWKFSHFGDGDVSKDKVLNIRIDPDLKKAAKKAAESENRSLSNWVTWLIQREIKRMGRKFK